MHIHSSKGTLRGVNIDLSGMCTQSPPWQELSRASWGYFELLLKNIFPPKMHTGTCVWIHHSSCLLMRHYSKNTRWLEGGRAVKTDHMGALPRSDCPSRVAARAILPGNATVWSVLTAQPPSNRRVFLLYQWQSIWMWVSGNCPLKTNEQISLGKSLWFFSAPIQTFFGTIQCPLSLQSCFCWDKTLVTFM